MHLLRLFTTWFSLAIVTVSLLFWLCKANRLLDCGWGMDVGWYLTSCPRGVKFLRGLLLLSLVLAHLARWRAAIFLRAAADIVRLSFTASTCLDDALFAYRAFCARCGGKSMPWLRI